MLFVAVHDLGALETQALHLGVWTPDLLNFALFLLTIVLFSSLILQSTIRDILGIQGFNFKIFLNFLANIAFFATAADFFRFRAPIKAASLVKWRVWVN